VDPADNPASKEKIALGYTLFFDKRLSKDDSAACAGCHLPEHGWAHPDAVNPKVGGAKNKRNAPSMANLAYHTSFYWDGRMPTVEAVSNAAWKGQLGADPAEVAKKLNAVPGYTERFKQAFNAEASAENIPKALAAFLRALKSGDSPYDKSIKGDANALSAQASNGSKIFQTAGCVSCHTPPLFSDLQFHNVGIGTALPAAEQDNGRMDHTKQEADKGRFKTPSLRDVARTGPYFHDGSAATLDDAINIMVRGGIKNPGLDPLLQPKKLTDAERKDLRAFLEALSGTTTFTAAAADVPK